MKLLLSLLFGLCFSKAIAYPAIGQVIPDGTTDTVIDSQDNSISIDAGDRTGNNLFHSFEQFSVPNGGETFFNNPMDIVNIFSRVTGGNISNIDGLIRANGEANLFLINPAGIVFSEGASLDIGGSFMASTAESIVFADDIEFSAANINNSPLLTINQPIGLNFGNNIGDITVNDSNLEVNNGSTLALFGGDIVITGGQIIAPGANIQLGGLKATGQISFEQLEIINFPQEIARGNITLTDSTEVNVQAASGGNINLYANNIELLEASNLRLGIAAESGSIQGEGGDIVIDATDNLTIIQESGIRNRIEISAVGNLGSTKILTQNLLMNRGGRVDASTLGTGNAGDIKIDASETISIDGVDPEGAPSGVGSVVAPLAIGNSGKVEITAKNISLTGGGLISTTTLGEGDAGIIAIETSETISINGASPTNTFGSGIYSVISELSQENNSGRIDIKTANLSLTNGGVITAVTFGEADAGIIAIKASESILIEGSDIENEFGNGIFSRTETTATGNAAGIDIKTNNLYLTNNGEISVESTGLGEAGNLDIEANSFTIADGAALFASTPVGVGGNINLQIANNLVLQDNSIISAEALKNANGGNINIDAQFVIASINQNNDIVAVANRGIGGNINITTSGLFGITEGSSMPANNTNNIDASSQFGLDGTVAINELDVNPIETLEELPIEIIDITRLIAQNLCQQDKGSEFIITGKGGMSASPFQTRDGEIDEIDLIQPAIASEKNTSRGEQLFPKERATPRAQTNPKSAITEAQGWIINDRGNLELVAQKTDTNNYSQPKSDRICQKH